MCEVTCSYCGLGCGLIGAITGTNSGVPRHLSSNLGGGLMLRGTSGVPVLPTQRGKGTPGRSLSGILLVKCAYGVVQACVVVGSSIVLGGSGFGLRHLTRG